MDRLEKVKKGLEAADYICWNHKKAIYDCEGGYEKIEAVETALQELEQHIKESQWQPIPDASRDGTILILGRMDSDIVETGYWNEREGTWWTWNGAYKPHKFQHLPSPPTQDKEG